MYSGNYSRNTMSTADINTQIAEFNAKQAAVQQANQRKYDAAQDIRRPAPPTDRTLKAQYPDASVPAIDAPTVRESMMAKGIGMAPTPPRPVQVAPTPPPAQGNYWAGSDGVRRNLTWDASGKITSGLRDPNAPGVAADRAANNRAIMSSTMPTLGSVNRRRIGA